MLTLQLIEFTASHPADLQTIPFRNYPNFVNLFTSFLYIILSFVYIIPVQRKGVSITKEQVDIPKRVFIIMGVLDSVSGILQVLF